ncbi:putative NADH:ubiquinone oxidoreductase 39 kDa subunit precursor [Haematococcus lacustris]
MFVGLLRSASCGGLCQVSGMGLRLSSVASCSNRDFSTDIVAITNKGLKQGPGGRSSVSGIVATIFGGSGFLGSYVTNELAKRGSQVIVPHRSTENAVQHIKQMGDLGQVILLPDFHLCDEEMVSRAIHRSNVVINMVGQRTETMNYTYEDVHVQWPQRLGRIVAANPQVERLIHFSEIGAVEGHKSRRMDSKARGDKLIMAAVPDATIVKPGPIVGVEDHFYNYLIYQLSFGVIAPVYDGGKALMQPTWVPDVSEATYTLLKRPESKGKTYYLGGPETLSVREVYDTVIKTLRLFTDDTIHVPKPVARTLLGPMDWVRRHLPGLPMDNYFNSVDYVEEVTRNAVAPRGALGYKDLGLRPSKVTDGLALEPVRHFRKGGYRWGDMAKVAKDVPEHIRKYYNIK